MMECRFEIPPASQVSIILAEVVQIHEQSVLIVLSHAVDLINVRSLSMLYNNDDKNGRSLENHVSNICTRYS